MLKSIIHQLKQKETWIGICIIFLILSLSFLFTLYAMKFDFISRIQGLTMTCSDLTNKIILTVTFTVMAFFISSTMFIGEFINYVEAKKIKNKSAIIPALRNTIIGGCLTTITGTVITFLLFTRC